MEHVPTQLLPATPEHIALAAEVLRRGGLVAFPTETVYGLGANALDADAVARIFAAKERPAADPLIVHLSGAEQLPLVARHVSPLGQALAEAFWPGPLTLVLPKQPQVPAAVTAGLDTVAVRVPDHPVAQALLRAAGVPVAAPSANRFGRTSPTTAQHVWHDLRGRIEMILDGGPTPVGVESTVVDASASPVRILRPGGVTAEMLEAVVGPVTVEQRAVEEGGAHGLPSPGLLRTHYAPRAELVLYRGRRALNALRTDLAAALAAGRRPGVLAMDAEAEALAAPGALVYRLGADLEAAAQRLYAGMRWLDGQGVDVILACDVAGGGLGLALRDRLSRAASRVVIAD
ncbi:MAG: L-threonylcarbamoyladenylate synthase [Caldilineales bacterium]|nr:L-threonylcarbamoyladenylate synthase [Caldilineales bacterium]MDW8319263.1 L-threonylcarbamoyladenylate synthase [Anaerolineae bacterium]